MMLLGKGNRRRMSFHCFLSDLDHFPWCIITRNILLLSTQPLKDDTIEYFFLFPARETGNVSLCPLSLLYTLFCLNSHKNK
jgi:hypothetical protein